MKTQSRKSIVAVVTNTLGVINAGPRKSQPTKVWSLVDPWGDVSFKYEGVRVTVWCREPRRRTSSIRFCGLPGTGIKQTLAVSRKIQALINLPALFEACG